MLDTSELTRWNTHHELSVFAGGGWALGTDLPLNRGGMGKCVCTGGACYVFGGEVNGAIAPSLANRVNTARTVFRTDIYDVASNSWSLGTVRPPPHSCAPATCPISARVTLSCYSGLCDSRNMTVEG